MFLAGRRVKSLDASHSPKAAFGVVGEPRSSFWSCLPEALLSGVRGAICFALMES